MSFLLFSVLNSFIIFQELREYFIPNIIYTNENLLDLFSLLSYIFVLIYLFLCTAFIIFFTCQSVQRLHDFNASGRWLILRFAFCFLMIIPDDISLVFFIFWVIFELALLLKKGTIGLNKYG